MTLGYEGGNTARYDSAPKKGGILPRFGSGVSVPVYN